MSVLFRVGPSGHSHTRQRPLTIRDVPVTESFFSFVKATYTHFLPLDADHTAIVNTFVPAIAAKVPSSSCRMHRIPPLATTSLLQLVRCPSCLVSVMAPDECDPDASFHLVAHFVYLL